MQQKKKRQRKTLEARTNFGLRAFKPASAQGL